MGAVNDHAAIVKKPLSLKTTCNNSSTIIPRDHRDSQVPGGGAGTGPGGAVGPGNLDRESGVGGSRVGGGGGGGSDRERERDRPGIREVGNAGQKFGHSQGQLKRSPSFTTCISTGNSHAPHGPPPPKKHKVTSARDISIAEAGKHGSLADYAFFDKVVCSQVATCDYNFIDNLFLSMLNLCVSNSRVIFFFSKN